MDYRRIIMIVLSLVASETLAITNKTENSPSSRTVERVVKQAYKDIEKYFSKAEKKDRQNLAEYLEYYRSEGQYQAVTPAPKALRDALSSEAQALFNVIKKRARIFAQKPKPLAGASSLTARGEEFYQQVIAYFRKRNTQEAVQKEASASRK